MEIDSAADVQSLHRRARDVFHLRDGHEVAQVAEFHGAKDYAWGLS